MKSIKKRLVGSYLIVIITTVIIIDIFLIIAVKNYFYNSIEVLLINKLKISSELYERYFSSSSLKDNIMDDVDFFYEDNTMQVQIYDENGNMLMDSIGVFEDKASEKPDVERALKGNVKSFIGKVDYCDNYIMAVSYPLKNDGKIIGAIRYITSLKEVNIKIIKISIMFMWGGLIVIIISGMVSLKLSNTIIKPIKNLNSAAEKMAAGDFNVKSIKKYDDEIGKLSDTLNYMADEIIKRDKFKNDFISSISHELRTPLTSIKGWAVTLKTMDMSDKELTMDGLEIIEKECDRLTKMVDELLDISRFISGKNSLKKEKINFNFLIENVKKQLLPRANAEGINLIIESSKDNIYIYADEDKIKQVFINIFDNSLRYTPKNGKISLLWKIAYPYLLICIKDTGCGIPKEELPYIKEKFFKGKNSKSKNGLGLSICDEIIKMHGGRLEIKSEVNVGTEVYIYLPLMEDSYEE